MFDINNQIPYEVYVCLSHDIRLNTVVTRNFVGHLTGGPDYPALVEFASRNADAVDRPVSLYIAGNNATSRNYIDSRWNPEVSGILAMLELYNIMWRGIAIKQLNYNLPTILDVFEALEQNTFNIDAYNYSHNFNMDIPTLTKLLKPDIYKTFYTIYQSANATEPRLEAEHFEEAGYVKVNTDLWNLIVTKAMERDIFEDEKFFKELYYNETKDQYIYYTNTGDAIDKNWTPIAAFLYAVANDDVVQQRFSEPAMDLINYTLNIFKYKRVTKGEGLDNAKQIYLSNDSCLNKLKQIIANIYIKEQFKNAIITNKVRNLEQNKSIYRVKTEELITLETRIKNAERDIIAIENEVPKLMQAFSDFINNKEVKHYQLTADGRFIYTITTPMDFVETDLIEMLRVTEENWRVVNLLRDLYLESNGYIYGTSTFELNLDNKEIRLTEEQPFPLGTVKDIISNSGNPHHTGYHCLGSYQRHLGTMANNLDFVGLFNMSLAAVKNFNVADSAVIERYSTLLNSIYIQDKPAQRCMVNYNEEPVDYLRYLEITSHVMDTDYEVYYDEEYDDDALTDWDIIENRISIIATQITEITNPRLFLNRQTLETKYSIIYTNFMDLGNMIGNDLSNVLADVYYDEETRTMVDNDGIFYDFYEQLPYLIEYLSLITLDFGNFLAHLSQYIDIKISQIPTRDQMNVPEDLIQTLNRIAYRNTNLIEAIELFQNLEIDFNSIAFENIKMNLHGCYIFPERGISYGDYIVALNTARYPLQNNQKLIYAYLLDLIETYLPKEIVIDTDTLLDDILAAMIAKRDSQPEAITRENLEAVTEAMRRYTDIPARRQAINERRRADAPIDGTNVREFVYIAADNNPYEIAEDVELGLIGTTVNGLFTRFPNLEAFEEYLIGNPGTNPQRYPYEYRASNGNIYTIHQVINPDDGQNLIGVLFDGNTRIFENIIAFEDFLQTIEPLLDDTTLREVAREMYNNNTTTWTGDIATGREATTDEEPETATREEDFEW